MENKYPEKTCSIEKLVSHPKLVEATLAGKKTQQRRNGVYAYPGEKFTLEDKTFVVTGLTRQALGDMTDADAMAEGYPSIQMYKALIEKMHQGANISFDDKSMVWVHEFELEK